MNERGPLRILVVAPTWFFSDYGNSVRIAEEARAVQELGNDLSICTYGAGKDPEGLVIKRIPLTPNKPRPGFSFHRLYLDIQLLALTAWQAYRWRPDIIHAHIHEGALIGLICKALMPRPCFVVVDAQGSLTEELLGPISEQTLLAKVFRFFEGYLWRKPDAIVTSSPGLAKVMEEQFGVGQDRVFTVPDGVDCHHFDWAHREDAVAVSRTRGLLGVPPNAKVVGYLGLLSKLQGIDLLLKAIPYVLAEQPDTYFVIGGHPNQEHYENEARQLGINDYVRFPGRVDYFSEAAQLLAAVDVAVSPKLFSGQSNGKLLNYMAMGLPTVVFDNEANRALLGDCGVYATEQNPRALARTLVDLLKDGPLMAELGHKARAKAEAECSWMLAGEQLVGLFERVLQKGRDRLPEGA